MTRLERALARAALAGIFCATGCTVPTPAERAAETGGTAESAKVTTPAPAAPSAGPRSVSRAAGTGEAPVEIAEQGGIVTIEPVSEPRYAAPESLKQFRFAQKNQPGVVLAKPGGKPAPQPPVTKSRDKSTPADKAATAGEARIELAAGTIPTVNAEGEGPRYKLPDSLKEWRSEPGAGRKVPLYEDPDAAPWQAAPTEARLRNAAVSCNYKDEGGVRGKVMLLIDDFKVTRFNARIEMPNGGVCQFDAKKMEQRPFEQGIALQSNGDECVVRMWEQKHRITIAAYSCHKQCSKGSFSYLWPILMDTRIGTCY